MKKYILKRLLYMFIAIFFISLITFVLVKCAPGNFLETQRYMEQNMSGAASISPEMQKEWQKAYDLDKPEWYQYFKFTVNAFRLKFGPSFKYPNYKIEDLIAMTLPVSMRLAFSSMFFALLIGIPLGIVAAVHRNTLIDRIAVLIAMIGQSVPGYVIAVFLTYLLANKLHLVPTVGWGKPSNYVLPICALAIGPVGTITRYMRSSMIETFEKDYIKVAIAKGGGFNEVVMKHTLRNSLIPLITVIGPQLAHLIVGTVFIESLFGIPGLGQYFASAAINRDYPMVMASTIFFAFIVMFTNLVVDIIYGILDPRIKKNSMEG